MPTLNIIGAGKLGRTLFNLVPKSQYQTVLLARGDTITAADITLITVQDSEIPVVAQSISRSGTLIHCSGTHDHEILRPHPCAGTMHPLMTFPGPEVHSPNVSSVPAAVSGDAAAIVVATALASDLGFTPFTFTGNRALYHAAAVMAGNFTTHLYRTATNLLRDAGVPEKMINRALLPLTLQSATNAADFPEAALTGPAARGADEIISAHIDALTRANKLDTVDLYNALTNSIISNIQSKSLSPSDQKKKQT